MDDDKVVQVVNLTGRPFRLGDEKKSVYVKSHGQVRLEPQYEEVDHVRLMVNETLTDIVIPVLKVSNRQPRSMPEAKDGVLYVVSGLAEAASLRQDVVAPARLHRKADGRVSYARAVMFTELD